jgi:hypothetical protein
MESQNNEEASERERERESKTMVEDGSVKAK